ISIATTASTPRRSSGRRERCSGNENCCARRPRGLSGCMGATPQRERGGHGGGRNVRLRSATDFMSARKTLPALQAAAAGCRGCELYKRGTQTVFGEGRRNARVMMVGEQPGNEEDLAGHPFVGPAGTLLDRALAAAGIDRGDVYVTNVVKHFKWEP